MSEPGSRFSLEKPFALLAAVAGWALLFLAFLVSAEIFLRKFFAFSLQGADEIGGYILAITSAVGFSYALVSRAHIRIDIIAARLPVRPRAILDVIGFVFLNLYLWLLIWRAFVQAWQSYDFGAIALTPLKTPLVVPQLMWAIALLLFGMVALGFLVVSVVRLCKGRWEDALIELGTSALEVELEHELADTRARVRRDDGTANPETG